MAILIVLWFLILFFLVFMLTVSWKNVPAGKYLVIDRRFFLLPPPAQGHFIARPFHQGPRAKVYTTGLQFIPFVNVFTKTEERDLVEIPAGKFGLVEALDGEPLKPGQIVAEKVVECENFTDGDVFLLNGGQKGFQIPLLSPGQYPINEKLFKIKLIPRVVIETRQKNIEISVDGKKEETFVPTIGLVTLNIGREMTEKTERVLARHVEGHNNFQNMAPFIRDQIEGELDKEFLEKGIQIDVLEPGAYAQNPEIVSVEHVEVPFIRKGEVGVIISSVGDRPKEDEDENEIDTVVINGRGTTGFVLKKEALAIKELRGIRPNVLDPGFVPFKFSNPIAYKIITVPTAPVAIDWATKEKHKRHDHPASTAIRFDPIEVVTEDAFTVPIEAELVVSVAREDAPKIIALAGSVRELITDLVVPIFDDIAKTLISKKPLSDLITKRGDIRKEIEKEVKEGIERYPMTIVSFRISEFGFEESPDAKVREYVDVIADRAIAGQQEELIAAQKKVQEKRADLERLRAIADNQKVLVGADFQKRAADDQRKAIKQRSEALAGLGPIQSLVADADAISKLVDGITSIAQSLLVQNDGKDKK